MGFTLSRRTLLLGLLLGSPIGLTAQAPQLTTIRYTTPSITAVNWPLFVADAEGFLTREHLRVDITQLDPTTLVAGILTGAADISLNAPVAMILAADKGAPIAAIASGCDRAPYKLMVPASIRTIKDLKGKSISAASPIELFTSVIKDILRKGGLDPERDVSFVYGGGQNQRFAALMGGGVQAGLVTPPNDALLEEKGFHSLAFTPDYTNLPISVTVARRDWAEQHADTVRGFLRAMASASQWLNGRANKAAAIALLANRLHTTPERASVAYDYYVVKAHVFPNNYCAARSSMQTVLTTLHEEGRTASTAADVDKYTDTQWCS